MTLLRILALLPPVFPPVFPDRKMEFLGSMKGYEEV
jgi:hypothetical protein